MMRRSLFALLSALVLVTLLILSPTGAPPAQGAATWAARPNAPSDIPWSG